MATTAEAPVVGERHGLGVPDEEHREVEGLVPGGELLAVGDPRP